MILLNGRGQLGEELKTFNMFYGVTIYHTWNFLDKSKAVQEECYNKR